MDSDLYMYENWSIIYLQLEDLYESSPSVLLNNGSYTIKEVEVLQVTGSHCEQ